MLIKQTGIPTFFRIIYGDSVFKYAALPSALINCLRKKPLSLPERSKIPLFYRIDTRINR